MEIKENCSIVTTLVLFSSNDLFLENTNELKCTFCESFPNLSEVTHSNQPNQGDIESRELPTHVVRKLGCLFLNWTSRIELKLIVWFQFWCEFDLSPKKYSIKGEV